MNRRHIVVFSGGSAANNLVDVFGKVAEDQDYSLSYVIPISDNGGSSSELIRVLGGPGIGDVRSRLVRLIPEDPTGLSSEKTAIKTLFNHRLSSDPSLARVEWLDIVEARHSLWTNISSEKRELIRSFLNTINLEIVKRARPSSVFNFQSASVGNLFLTGARLFTGSFESAIYLLSSITSVPPNISVIPAINSNFSHHISAGLVDGTVITGQNSISHPITPSFPKNTDSNHNDDSNGGGEHIIPESPTTHLRSLSKELTAHDHIEDANLPGSLPTLRKQYITFQKTHTADLPSRIERIWYINPYGQEIRPAPNPKVLQVVGEASVVVYCIGSLYTSLVPCLVLRGVGEGIAGAGSGIGIGGGGVWSGSVRCRILILNGSLDRETRWSTPSSSPSPSSGEESGERESQRHEFTAKDFIAAIADACAYSRGRSGAVSEEEWREYVTHVIHLVGEGTPRVEKEDLRRLGIEVVRIYGRKVGEGMVYDGVALTQALEAVMGSPKRDWRGDKSRRNTLGVS